MIKQAYFSWGPRGDCPGYKPENPVSIARLEFLAENEKDVESLELLFRLAMEAVPKIVGEGK